MFFSKKRLFIKKNKLGIPLAAGFPIYFF